LPSITTPVIEADVACTATPLLLLPEMTFRPVMPPFPTVIDETLLIEIPLLLPRLPAPAAFVPTRFPKICVPVAPVLRTMPPPVLPAMTLPSLVLTPPIVLLTLDTEMPVPLANFAPVALRPM